MTLVARCPHCCKPRSNETRHCWYCGEDLMRHDSTCYECGSRLRWNWKKFVRLFKEVRNG